jgi:hypothetical protein
MVDDIVDGVAHASGLACKPVRTRIFKSSTNWLAQRALVLALCQIKIGGKYRDN